MVLKAPKRPRNPMTITEATVPPPGLLSSPEHVIEYCRQRGLTVDPMVDIEQIILSNSDLSLVRADLGLNDAYIKRVSEGKFEIGVNAKHHPNRQRFSMAHEYAHYLLHRNKIESLANGEQILHRNEDRNPVEYQANDFAANLLIPEALFKGAFERSGGNLKKIAETLMVSQEALKHRLSAMGYRIV